MAYKIYLSPPHMGGREMEYIQDAFASNWIAPCGPAVSRFETEMARYIGVSSALAVSSGTAALHLIFRWLGITEGDLVFCSDFTFIGSCDPIFYERAVPVFIDSEPDSWNMSPQALQEAFSWAKSLGKLPKAVVIVDLYGESARWDALLPICRRYGVPVIEDAAEAAGTEFQAARCGSFGDYSILSFNGNKIITTSGGGMVLCNDSTAIQKMKFWATQAREPYIHYEHREYGYNYRMSNLGAAVGCGQLEFLPRKMEIRRRIHGRYRQGLAHLPAHIKTPCADGANHWLNLLYIDTDAVIPYDVVTELKDAGIEARPAWKPMHMQPVFEGARFFPHEPDRAVDEEIFARAVCLPSGDAMSDEQVDEVIGEVGRCFRQINAEVAYG